MCMWVLGVLGCVQVFEVFQGILVNYCTYCNYCANDVLSLIVAFSYGSNKGKGTG